MSERAGRPAMERPLAFLSVAERLDFLGETVLFINGDPLEDLEPFLQLLDFVAQSQVFSLVSCRNLAAGATTVATVAKPCPDDRGEHDDRHDPDHHHFAVVHCTLSPLSIASRSRSASI